MGCDIHVCIEVLDVGEWKHLAWLEEVAEVDADGALLYEIWTGKKLIRTSDEKVILKYSKDEVSLVLNYDKLFKHPLYLCRDYRLFSILAGVRNGFGFAGCDTGDAYNPISEQKGLPKDISAETLRCFEVWQSDAHSTSWLTLKELLDYDWKGQNIKHRGVVRIDSYKIFKKKGKPNSWAGGVSGKMIKAISNEEMDLLVEYGYDKFQKKIGKNKDKKAAAFFWDNLFQFTTKVEWEESYYNSVSYVIDKFIPALQELGKPDEVRLVFWFDN